MISFEEAYERVMALSMKEIAVESVPLLDSVGRILAEDIASDMDMPPFDKSAMDGYACMRKDLALGQLTVIEEIPAGVWPKLAITEGFCSRILTGAPLPQGADCVIMQEQTERRENRVRILDPKTADNICRRAEDIACGSTVLSKGERITPAHIAVLATLGVTEPVVAKRPRVTILATGSELVEPSQKPALAQIRNSNSWQLAAQVKDAGGEAFYSGILVDQEDVITKAVQAAMERSDVILLSGGVSTGDFDLVPGILKKLGFTTHFNSVAMQPGRPTVFAQNGGCFCFGLPGNPVSTFVVFELLVKPFLLGQMGHPWRPIVVEARLSRNLERRNTARQASLPVRFVAPDVVEPLEYHGSAHINAMTNAHGLICIPRGSSGFKEGERLRVRLL